MNGLFHKDGIKETAYDLHESLWQDMQKMQGMGGENKITKFLNTLKEMQDNKYFKEFFLFHEKSLETGLQRLDEDIGRHEYFAKMLMDHICKTNDYRKLNAEAF